MPRVDLEELYDALLFVSDLEFDNDAYVSLDTGEIQWVSHDDRFENKRAGEEYETSDRYVKVPNKLQLGLGRGLVFLFVKERLPEHYDEVRDMFGRRGAYARFREFLIRKGCLDEWYAFEDRETRAALREWCEKNGFEAVERAGK